MDDSLRRSDVCGWASVYRKQVDENPDRSSVRAMDKPFVKNPWLNGRDQSSVRMHPGIDRDVPEAEKAIHEAAS